MNLLRDWETVFPDHLIYACEMRKLTRALMQHLIMIIKIGGGGLVVEWKKKMSRSQIYQHHSLFTNEKKIERKETQIQN